VLSFSFAAGPVPKGYSIPWRGNSALRDGLDSVSGPGPKRDLTGGFYDAGDNVKFVFPGSYAMTILSWGVIEYKQKYIAAKQYDHVRTIIRWGTDFMFKTFNYTVNTTDIAYIYAQVILDAKSYTHL
jgi:endoglucanase